LEGSSDVVDVGDPSLAIRMRARPRQPTSVVGHPTGHTRDDNLASATTSSVDPVNFANGDFYIHRSDLALPAVGVSFDFQRAYHSRLEFDGTFGFGWDHNYYQRILPTQDDSCTGEVVYAMGLGRSMRFEVASETFTHVVYKAAQPVRFTLSADKDHGMLASWTVAYPDGLTLSFDGRGLLRHIADSTLPGLDIRWESAPDPIAWRVKEVIDSAGRIFSFTYYTANGRLESVSEPTSKLGTYYTYDAKGDLRTARDAFGRTESYEYEDISGIPVEIPDANVVPEQDLRAACAQMCSPKSETCHSIGACEDADTHYRSLCDELGPECVSECKDACRTDIHDINTLPGNTALIECADSPSDPTREGCNQKGDECDDYCGSELALTRFDRACAQIQHDGTIGANCSGRCTEVRTFPGDGCGQTCGTGLLPCNEGQYCFKQVIFGEPPPATGVCSCSQNEASCPAEDHRCPVSTDICHNTAWAWCTEDTGGPGYEGYSTCYYLTANQCSTSCVDGCEKAIHDNCVVAVKAQCRNACIRGCEADCIDQTAENCAANCDGPAPYGCDPSNWDANHCANVNWGGLCRSGCLEECVASGREAGTTAWYGTDTDLLHNLAKIRDGEGKLYLQNTYGHDFRKPDYDSVKTQVMGDTSSTIAYRDLVYESDHPSAVPNDDLAKYVVGLGHYDNEIICPTFCAVQPFFADVSEFVPWAGGLVVFRGLPSVGGLAVTGASSGSLPPTVVTLSAQGAKVTEGESLPTNINFTITTSRGRVVVASNGRPGELALSGASTAVAELRAYGQLTLVTESPSGRFRVYPGAPRGLIHISQGACSTAFQAQRAQNDDIVITPSSACTPQLEMAPLATQLEGPGYLADLRTNGPTAFASVDLFAATVPVPGRHSVTLAALTSSPGHYVPSVGSRTGRAPSGLMAAAERAASLAPLFNAPRAESSAPPLYAFHVPTSERPGGWETKAYVFDSGDDFAPRDFDPIDCTKLDGPAVHGRGPLPSTAAVVKDAYGVVTTYYYDDDGQLLRSANESTHAVRSYNYNAFGELIGVESPLIDRVCASYDGVGNLTSTTEFPVPNAPGQVDPIVHKYEYQQNPTRLRKVFDPLDPSRVLVTYDWTTEGYLDAAHDAYGRVTTFHDRTAWGAPTTITTPDGSVTSVSYDNATGLVLGTIVDALGDSPISTTTSYDDAGRPQEAIGPLGGRTTYQWSKDPIAASQVQGPFLHALRRVGGTVDTTATFLYDLNGQIKTQSSELATTSTVYDDFGFPRRAEAVGLRNGPNVAAVQCQHNGPMGRLLEAVRPEGERLVYGYDGEGRVTTVQQGYGAPSAASAWDDDCPTHTTAGDPSSEIGPVATMTYDLDGRVKTITKAGHGTTTIDYDGFGRPITVTDSDGNQTRTGYDAAGQVRWRASYNGAPLQVDYGPPIALDIKLIAASEFTYDLLGRPSTVDRWHFDTSGSVGDGHAVSTYVYDDVNRKVTTTDDAGFATVTTLDGAGRVRRVAYASGDVVTTTYSLDGATITTTRTAPTPSGTLRTRVLLDAWGQPLRTEAEVSGAWVTTRESQYDAWGRTSVVKAGGGLPLPPDSERYVETLDYDGFSRVSSQVRATGTASAEILSFTYDRDGRLRERHSKAGPSAIDAVTVYTWDGLDRVKRISRPAGHFDENTYDGRSPLPLSTSASGRLVQYSYFNSGRVSRMLAGANPATWSIRDFTYDGLGQLKTARDGGALPNSATDDTLTNLAWDSLGDRISESTAIPGTTPALTMSVSHRYDGRGLPTSSTLGTMTERRAFDALGRLTDVFVGSETTPVAHFAFGGLGGPISRTYSNGIATTYGYDALGRVREMTDRKGTEQVAKWQWSLPLDGVPRAAVSWRGSAPLTSVYNIDASGRVAGEDHGIASVIADISASTSTPSANTAIRPYLHLGRTSPTGGFGTGTVGSAWRDYTMDGRDNWVVRQGGTAGLNVTPSLDLEDAYTSFGGAATYFADGSLKTLNGEQYTYNAFGELTDLQTTAGRTHFDYDALGRRVKVTTTPSGGAATTMTLGYDGALRALRKNPSESSIETTLDGDGLDEHLVRVSGDTARSRFFYHQDRSNSVYMVSKQSGAAAEFYQYTSYGDATVLTSTGVVLGTSSIGNRFGFQGQPSDVTGLVDMRGRFYRPAWGRFVSADPIRLAGGSNLYAFSGSAPLQFWDPWGTDRANFGGEPRDAGPEPEPVDPDTVCFASTECAGIPAVPGHPLDYGLPSTRPGFADVLLTAVNPLLLPYNLTQTTTSALDPDGPGANAFNPFYNMLVSYVEGKRAFNEGDYDGAAGAWLGTGLSAAGTVGVARLGASYSLALGQRLTLTSRSLGLAALRAGPLLEPAELGAVRGTGPPPELPTYAGGKTLGVFRGAAGDTPLRSGWSGPAESIPRGTSGFDIVTRTHVEGHAAAIMRQQGLMDGTVYINNPEICSSCGNLLPRMLPPGAELTVVTPTGSTTFVGITPGVEP
jgi:RHS repeat-associated protein